QVRIRLARFRAKAAAGKREFTRAMALASAAVEQARMVADDGALAAAMCTKALVSLRAVDLDIAANDSRASIVSARSAHDPVRSARARLMLAEIDRRGNRNQAAARIVDRLRRL